MATTSINPFVVQVVFKGVTYDTQIIPMRNGKDILLTQDHVDLLNRAEATNQLFSKKIEEMLGQIEHCSVETHGYLTEGSAEGFKFEKHPVGYKPTAELWKSFVNTLHMSAEHMVVTHPSIPVVSGSGARIEIKPNAYCSVSTEEQKKARLELFRKKCCDYFSQNPKAVRPPDYEESKYTPEETGYLEFLYDKAPKIKLEDEIWLISLRAKADEREEMAHIQLQIQQDLQLQAK